MSDLTDQAAGDTLDYLGQNQPLATSRLTTLPSAAAGGGGTVGAPLTPAGSFGGPGGGGLTVSASGGGLEGGSGPTGLQQFIGNLGLLRNIAARIAGGSADQTRGETGGNSLSDAVRSGSAPADVAGPVNPDLFGGVATPVQNLTQPVSLDQLLAVTGDPAQTGGSAASIGNLVGASEAVGQQAGEAALETTAENLALTLPSISDALTGVLTSGLIPIVESFFGVGPFGEGGGGITPGKIQETRDVRSAFTPAFDTLTGAPTTLADIAKTSDPQQLLGLLNAASNEISAQPSVSQFLGSSGGAQKGFVKPVDVSQIAPVSDQSSVDSVLGYTLALDKLSKSGTALPEGFNDAWASPMPLLNTFSNAANVPLATFNAPEQPILQSDGTYSQPSTARQPYVLSPEESSAFAQPGNRIQAIADFFSRLNPNFASTDLGQTIANILASQQAPAGSAAPAQAQAPAASRAVRTQPIQGYSLPGGTDASLFAQEVLQP